MSDTIFKSQEEAEAEYEKLATLYTDTLLNFQLQTARTLGAAKAQAELIQRQLDKDENADVVSDVHLFNMLKMTVKLRQSELLTWAKAAEGMQVMLPVMERGEMLRMVKESTEKSYQEFLLLGDKDKRQDTIKNLLDTIDANKDTFGLDDESPEEK